MSETARFSKIVRFSEIAAGRVYDFTLTPDAEARTAIAADLGITAIRKLRFEGALSPAGRKDWQLKARLGATVVQECVVSFAPVTTRIDADISRSYRDELPELTSDEEVEMPEDDTVDPLPAELDLAAVMIEALALALPEYPRAEGVAPLDRSFAEPGTNPLTDEATKPFAGLAGLRDKLAKDN